MKFEKPFKKKKRGERGLVSGGRQQRSASMDPSPCGYSREEIKRTITVMLNVFSVHPADAEHPGRHIAIREAVPVLSSLDRSHGLTVDQIEGLRRLLRNWSRIVREASAARSFKGRLSEHLFAVEYLARDIEILERKRLFLETEHQKISHRSCIPGFETVASYANQIQHEWSGTVGQIEKLKQRYLDLSRIVPMQKLRLQEAEGTLERARQEWRDLKMVLCEVNSSLFQVNDSIKEEILS